MISLDKYKYADMQVTVHFCLIAQHREPDQVYILVVERNVAILWRSYYDYESTTDQDSMYVALTVITPYILVRPFLLYIGKTQENLEEERSTIGTRLSYNDFELKQKRDQEVLLRRNNTGL